MMDHDLVVKTNVAERYLLGDLTEAERDAYEAHYFECPACAEELRCSSEFMHYAREVVREEAIAPEGPARDNVIPAVDARTPPVWMRAVPAGVFAVLLLAVSFSTYQLTVRFHGNQPSAEREASSKTPQVQEAAMQQPVAVKLSEARGPVDEQGEIVELDPAQPFQLNVDISARIRNQGFDSYQAVIMTEAGRVIYARGISKEEAADVVEWRLPVGQPGSGRYSATIRAFDGRGAQREIKGNVPRISFQLKKQGH